MQGFLKDRKVYRGVCPGAKLTYGGSTSHFVLFLVVAESSRAYLKHIENVESSDYINACYVDVSV